MKRIPWYALMVLVAGSCFGLVSPILKIAYQHGFTAAEATDAQYILGVVVLWLMVPFQRRRYTQRIVGKQWPILLVLGLCSTGTSFTYYTALTYLPASVAIVLLFQFSWMVMIMDWIVTRQAPSAERWVGAVLIFAGTFFAVGLVGDALHHVPLRFPVWTLIFGLLAGFFYAMTLYLSAYVDARSAPITRSAVIISFATLAVFIPFPPTFITHLGSNVGELALWGFLMALFSQILPPIMMMIAIPHTGGRMAGVLGSIELPVAVFAAWAILHEHVDSLRWLGVMLILLGIVVSEWPRKPAGDPVSTA